jgi:hypothetical protein
MPPLGIQVNAVLGFKSGRVQGPREVSLTVKGPQNTVLERKQPVPVHFPGGHLGFNLAFTLGFESREAGVHWIDVLVDENLVTSMPLEIVHEVQTSQQNQTSEAPEQE